MFDPEIKTFGVYPKELKAMSIQKPMHGHL
jgi:hypothetical protein